MESLSYRLGRSEARAELTEKAESTLREERDRLARELEEERSERRRLAERLERLEGARAEPVEDQRRNEPTDVSEPEEASEEEPPTEEPEPEIEREATEIPDEEDTARRPWWLKWLGG